MDQMEQMERAAEREMNAMHQDNKRLLAMLATARQERDTSLSYVARLREGLRGLAGKIEAMRDAHPIGRSAMTEDNRAAYLLGVSRTRHAAAELVTALLADVDEGTEPDGYYIASFKHGYVGNDVLFWGKESRGYTCNLEDAGIYSREEAIRLQDPKCVSGCMVPVAWIRSRQKSVINCERVSKQEIKEASREAFKDASKPTLNDKPQQWTCTRCNYMNFGPICTHCGMPHDDKPTLARNQPCGCVICMCEDQQRCHGCGAKHCGTHPVGQIPHPLYEHDSVSRRIGLAFTGQ